MVQVAGLGFFLLYQFGKGLSLKGSRHAVRLFGNIPWHHGNPFNGRAGVLQEVLQLLACPLTEKQLSGGKDSVMAIGKDHRI